MRAYLWYEWIEKYINQTVQSRIPQQFYPHWCHNILLCKHHNAQLIMLQTFVRHFSLHAKSFKKLIS